VVIAALLVGVSCTAERASPIEGGRVEQFHNWAADDGDTTCPIVAATYFEERLREVYEEASVSREQTVSVPVNEDGTVGVTCGWEIQPGQGLTITVIGGSPAAVTSALDLLGNGDASQVDDDGDTYLGDGVAVSAENDTSLVVVALEPPRGSSAPTEAETRSVLDAARDAIRNVFDANFS
jgi:hypothetical protein